MIEHIISDLNRKFAQILPSVKREIPTLEAFDIRPVSLVRADPNVNSEVTDGLERAQYCIMMRFSPQGCREDAVNAFRTIMEDRLGLPSSEGGAEEEVWPKTDYGYAQQNDDADVIDIDDDGNAVSNQTTPYHGTALTMGNKKYYAVEFRIAAPRGLPPPHAAGRLGGWNPNRNQLGRRNPRMLGY